MSLTSPRPGTSIAYAYGGDPESGSTPPGGFLRKKNARSPIRRFLAGRRTKIVLSVAGLTVILLYLTDSPSLPRPYVSLGGGSGGRGPPGQTGIWDVESNQDDIPKDGEEGWGWGFGSGSVKDPKAKDPAPATPTTGPQSYIAPAHPDLNLLPKPEELYEEFHIPASFRAPRDEPFPDTRLREVISPPGAYESTEVSGVGVIGDESPNKMWKGPKDWNGPRGVVEKVQWDGFAKATETKRERKEREARRDAVKRAFGYAWQGYKDFAWGADEVRPVSRAPSDPFNNWGATIIDTLDTLLIMGLSDEYNLCRRHVNQVNFNWVNGRDWSAGYASEAPATDDDETPSETWAVARDRGVGLPVFETSIRYLGGLLGVYDLSGDALLLDRATELADILSKAFNTYSGIPAGRIDPGANPAVYNLGQISIAEAGSMSLEFMRLSQITGNRTYFDLVQRAMDFLETSIIPRSSESPLIPLWFFPDAVPTTELHGSFAFGGLADSYYEYLIKTYKLLGGSTVAQQWKRIYEQSIDKAKEILYVDVDYIPEVPILAIGKKEGGRLIPELEHLTCFAGAMLGLGAKLLGREEDMDDAERVTSSCYWLSAGTPTGLQPEVVEFYTPDEVDGPAAIAWESISTDGHDEHPKEVSKDNTYEDADGVLRWMVDGEIVYLADGGRDTSGDRYERRLKGSPPGAKKVVPRGINRPETIESIFYMYRLTGDKKWQEKGWKMFVSWVTNAKAAAGVSSIEDVTKALDKIRFSDNMESFAFAETFKYHYLLQSEPDLISLDDYVLNTEAHPLIAQPHLHPGSAGLWHPPKKGTIDLGVRGQGTDAQKWFRLAVLQRNSGPQIQGSGFGGGRGMGGGGGDPNYRPKPPGQW